jgi:hypothetical protein
MWIRVLQETSAHVHGHRLFIRSRKKVPTENARYKGQVEMYVFQSSAWHLNLSNPTEFTMPKELEKAVECFEEFYRQEIKDRKLTWLHSMSGGTVELNYPKKRYNVTMGTFQMALFLVF